jgi:putative endopeptidase
MRALTSFVAIAAMTVPSAAAVDVLNPADLDTSVAPTADFYRYAVGGWRASHAIPDDHTSWGSFDEVEQRNEMLVRQILESPEQTLAPVGSARRKIGDFYAACTDIDAIEARGVASLRPELAAIASIPSSRALAPMFARLAATDPNDAPGFSFTSEQDPKAATRVIASIGQGGLSLPTRDYYLARDPRSVAIRVAFVRYMTRSFALLGDDAHGASVEANAVLALETALARISKTPDQLRDPFANYNPMPLARLEARAPEFDWHAYFAATGVSPTALEHIDVNQPAFASAFATLAGSAPLSRWKSYLRWRDVDAGGSALPSAFRDARFAFRKAVFGVKTQPPRWRTCESASDSALGFAIGRIYVAKYFSPAARARARGEIAAIRAALKSDMSTLAWMSPQTRRAALAKLAKLGTAKVGYPDRWRDYSRLRVGGEYLDDVFAANRFDVRRDIAKIGKPVDRTEWGLTPQTVNAYYDPSNNEIVIPAGILEKPFFDASADDAVNFGGIGVVIGHEMTHGYDDEGSDYDGDGNLHPIVTKADAARFHARVTCIVDQLDAYKTSVGLHLNGKLDAGEAAADLGGLTLSYRAMESSFARTGHPAPLGGFTAEQRYYVSFGQVWRENVRPEAERAQVLGDPHPVSAYRVNGTVADAENFDRAFDVKPGDAMYRPPAKRCAIW